MGRTAIVAACCVALAAALGSSASGGFTPAWSYVPVQLRTELAAQEGGSLYLPARTPHFYRYHSGATVKDGKLSAVFTNRVRVRQGVWRWTKQTFLWQVLPLAASTDCSAWATSDKTLQMSGNKVLWSPTVDGGTAWRCVTDSHGRHFVLTASQGGKLPDVALAGAVASGLDVSRRTPASNVSLSVIPARVTRGHSVLINGVAGGCTPGNTVTIISRAFAPTHSFAGVPSVSGRVAAGGRFFARAKIPKTRAPGRYVITARCGGGNLGVAAHLTVLR